MDCRELIARSNNLAESMLANNQPTVLDKQPGQIDPPENYLSPIATANISETI